MQKIYFLIIMLLSLTGYTTDTKDSRPVSVCSSTMVWLPDDVRKNYEEMVLAGDANHVTKLFIYYESYYYLPEKAHAIRWVLLGGKLKDKNAIQVFNLLQEEYITAEARKYSMPKNALFQHRIINCRDNNIRYWINL